MSQILNANGQPISSEQKIKNEVERLNTIMTEVRAFITEKGYGEMDVLNVGMNLLVQVTMEAPVNELKARCVQTLKMLDSGLGQALQMKMIEAKIRANLEASNTPNIAS